MSPTLSLKPNADVSVAIAVGTEELKRQLIEALGQAKTGATIGDVESGNGDVDAIVAYVERLQPAVLFLGIPGLTTDFATIIGRLAKTDAAPAIVAVSDSAEPGMILKAMRSGAAEFIYTPFETDSQEAVRRVMVHAERPQQSSRAAGRVLGFASVKGACGATTVSCHAASWLRQSAKKEVLLADLDSHSGITNLLMQIAPRYSVDDALQNLHRLDLKLWKAMVATSASGVDVIAAPTEPSVPVSRKLSPLLRFWRTQYDFTLLDLGHGITPTLLDTLSSLDTLVLVTTNDLLALKKTKEFIQLLAARDFGANRLKLVINRMPKRVSITIPELEKLLGLSIYSAIPNDYPLLNEAYSELRLADLQSDLGRRIGDLAAKLAGVAEPEKKPRKLFAFR